jgi:c-di-GMP-binding flagellar brake protein YcgR
MGKIHPETWLQYLHTVCEQSEASDQTALVAFTVTSPESEPTRENSRDTIPYPYERRRHLRITRCCRVRVVTDSARIIGGNTVNISDGGAMLSLSEWRDFREDDLIGIALFQNDGSGQRKPFDIAAKLGVIRRVQKESRQIAVMFVQDRPN